MGKGWSFPNSFALGPFTRWHDSQVQQNSQVSLFMSGHQYHCQTYSLVCWSPKCPSVACTWSNICVIIPRLQGMHMTSSKCWLVCQIRSFLTVKSRYSVSLSRISVNNLSSWYPDWICLINPLSPQVTSVASAVHSNSASASVRSSPYDDRVGFLDNFSDIDRASAALDTSLIMCWFASFIRLASTSRVSCCSCSHLAIWLLLIWLPGIIG